MTSTNLHKKYDDAVIERGEGYVENVHSCLKIENFLHARVQGRQLYKTKVDLDTLEGECSCPYEYNCKHAVATYLYYKKGKHEDTAKYMNDLKKLSKEELIKIIEKIVPENPEMIKNFTFRKKKDLNSWVDDFINNFSVSELENVKENIDCFSFEQLIKIFRYVDANEDSINESIADNYDSYTYDDESDILGDFAYTVKEEIIKKINDEKQLLLVLKEGNMTDEIVENAERFFKYKDVVKKCLQKKEYFIFLLNSKNPKLSEIKDHMIVENEHLLYFLAKDNLPLAIKIAEYLNNDNLRFLIAYHKEDPDKLVKYFSSFDNSKTHYLVQPERIINILSKNKVIPVNIAMTLYMKEQFVHYSEKSVRVLLQNLKNVEFILKNTDMSAKFSILKEVIKRLEELNYDTKYIFMMKELLSNKHWTEIVEILRYIKQSFGVEFLKKIIRTREKHFATSSTLKNHLKKEGILIQNIQGQMKVEIR